MKEKLIMMKYLMKINKIKNIRKNTAKKNPVKKKSITRINLVSESDRLKLIDKLSLSVN